MEWRGSRMVVVVGVADAVEAMGVVGVARFTSLK